jgi:hypothetical protein
VALDEAGQVLAPADAALAPDDDVFGVGRENGIGRVGLYLPRLTDTVIEIEVLVEGGIGGHEADGATVGGDAADAGAAAYMGFGNNGDYHRVPPNRRSSPQITQIGQIFKSTF